MKNYNNIKEPILQSEKFNMSSGAKVRIQIKEGSYIVTINFDTNMHQNLRMNTFKRGIRISSTLKNSSHKKISKTIIITRCLEDLSQLSEDTITYENEICTMTIVVKLKDFIRSDVKKACEKKILQQSSIE